MYGGRDISCCGQINFNFPWRSVSKMQITLTYRNYAIRLSSLMKIFDDFDGDIETAESSTNLIFIYRRPIHSLPSLVVLVEVYFVLLLPEVHPTPISVSLHPHSAPNSSYFPAKEA